MDWGNPPVPQREPGEPRARQADLHEVTLLAITSFPNAILPNKLLQELRALAKGAELSLPLVDEVAADIFMGEFSPKFLESTRRAADLLDRSLYASYYGIDYTEVRKLAEPSEQDPARWATPKPEPSAFVQLCASRAGVPLGTWDPATNGMIIEQQQILTTQNLAVLFAGLDLAGALREQLGDMAKLCFQWVCRRQQVKIADWHARLTMVKNTAYAWRQMVFFLALIPERNVTDSLRGRKSTSTRSPRNFGTAFAQQSGVSLLRQQAPRSTASPEGATVLAAFSAGPRKDIGCWPRFPCSGETRCWS